MGDLEQKDRVRITVGPKTGRVYTRDPTKCSKINGLNTQCQNPPAPGTKSCQHHLDQARNRHHRLKNQREGTRKAPELPKKRAIISTHEEQAHLYGKHVLNQREGTCKTPELPKKKRTKTSTHQEQAHLYRKHVLNQPEGTCKTPELPRKKRAKTSAHQEQAHLYGKQLMDEDQARYYEKKILPLNLFHTSKKGSIIVRKLYKTKAICDSVYRLNLHLNQRPPLKSWIEHNKMQIFDEQRMKVKEWMNINKASTNSVKKNSCN